MPAEQPRRIPVVFYRTTGGSEVVRDWLRGLEPFDRNSIGQDLMRVQYRWPIGMPLCRPMGQGLWELRTRLTDNRAARLLFCISDGKVLILHGFIKKTQKTPNEELALARKRKAEYASES